VHDVYNRALSTIMKDVPPLISDQVDPLKDYIKRFAEFGNDLALY